MHLSRRGKRLLAGLVVLGIVVFFQLKATDRPACTPGSCALPWLGEAR